MDNLNTAQLIAVWALPVLFAITVHEVAHGWVARRFGDPTAFMLGRLTLNPIKHIDPIGTLLVPGLLLMMGGFIFGWAKPVPVAWENLRNPKRDMAIVAFAGPMANLLMAIMWALLMKLGLMLGGQLDMLSRPLVYMGAAGISINVMLMVLNLLPLPPLDGGRVLAGFLPDRLAQAYNRIEPFCFFILLGLLISGALSYIMKPFVDIAQSGLYAMIGL